MAQFPIDNEDGLYEAVNYLASGPAGLGQNFAGFNSFAPAYVTGNFRIPFTNATPVNLYVPPIALSNAEQLDNRTIKYTFASAQPTAPFKLGNSIEVSGITPSTYNSADLRDAGYPITQIGVVECTTTYVIVRTRSDIITPLGTYVSGGDVFYRNVDTGLSTDCDVRVTVTGGTDRVIVAGQLDQIIDYEVLSGTQDLRLYVYITRRKAFIDSTDPANPDFLFGDDEIIVEKIYDYTGLSGTGSLPLVETVFSNIVDTPGPGYYRYILEIYFETFTTPAEIQVTGDELKLRSISAQVVKE